MKRFLVYAAALMLTVGTPPMNYRTASLRKLSAACEAGADAACTEILWRLAHPNAK